MKNLMIVDDDEIAQFIAKRIALSSGFLDAIHAVGNGRDALQMLSRPMLEKRGFPM